MKKILLLLIAFNIFAGTINAQKSDLNGIWKLTESFQYDDQTQIANTFITFKESGVIEVSGRDLGTWLKNESKNTLTIKCEQFDGIEGENKIETLDEKELKLINSNGDINILERISLPENKKLTNKYTGEWLLEKVEVDGKTDFGGELIDLNSDGIFYIQGIMLGKWDYNNSTKKIIFDIEEDFSGEHTILKSNETTFIIDVEGAKMYFLKIDNEKIAKENGASGLIGTWKLNNEENSDAVHILEFKSPDEFVFVEKTEYSSSTSKGTWIFYKNERTVILIGYLDILRGLNKVIYITNDEISLENYGTIYSLKKEKKQDTEIERLTFEYEEFFTEDGDFKYEADVDKLPWQDPMEMMMSLVNVKQLVYKYSTLIKNTESFEVEILTADVNSNPQKQEITIDCIFYGYDRYNLPEDAALPPNEFDEYNKLYPDEDNSLRVVGSEQITTPAGTFDCIVVEVLIDDEARKKLWMINEKPSIYAKIIDDKEGRFGHYSIYELQEIK